MKNEKEKKQYTNLSEDSNLYKKDVKINQTSNNDYNEKIIFSRTPLIKNNCHLFIRKIKKHILIKNVYFILILLIIFIVIVTLTKTISNNNKKKFFNHEGLKNNSKNIDIYFEEKFPDLKKSFKKAYYFLDKCLKNESIDSSKFNISQNPKVSAVIPFYNRKNTISRAIKSIQNQDMKDFEIILINDFSLDETMEIVEQIKKEDKRIKVINNKKVMGTLYSRSIGTLYAKGKYIFPLDSDDMLLDEDIYSTITNTADKGNFDIVSFRIIYSIGSNILKNEIGEYSFSDHANNLVLFQPELGLYPIRPGKELGQYSVIDVLLWNKCFRTKIYKESLNKMGSEKYSRYMIYNEDLVATCFLFNTAKSMKYVGKYGVLHIKTPMSASLKYFLNKEMNFYNLYLIDVAIDFTKDTFESRKLLVYLITFLIDSKDIRESLEESKFNILFTSCLNKILNMKYISSKDKDEIRKRISKLNITKVNTF